MHRLHLSPFPFLSFPLLVHGHSRASHRAHASSCICMLDSSPLLGPAAPRVRLLLSFSLTLSLSPPLPPLLHTNLFPLSAARLVELFFVCRASLLYRCCAPTTASREPTGKRVTTFRSELRSLVHGSARHSFARCSESHGTAHSSCVRLTRVKSQRLRFARS